MLEDLTVNDSTNLFEDKLESAVKKFKKRYGLKEDGIISGKTLLAMSIPVHEQIQQILINKRITTWKLLMQKGSPFQHLPSNGINTQTIFLTSFARNQERIMHLG